MTKLIGNLSCATENSLSDKSNSSCLFIATYLLRLISKKADIISECFFTLIGTFESFYNL